MPDAVILAPQWIAPIAPTPEVLTGHAVLIEGGDIAALGPLDVVRQTRPDTRLLPLPGHLLTPGFVNLHTHAAMSLLRGLGDDLPLQRWLRERIWPAEKRLVDAAFVRDGAMLSAYEMLMSGITCFNDMYFFPEAAIEAALALGMRSVHGIVVIDFASAYASAPADYLRKGFELRDRYRDEARVGFCLAPHAPYTVSDDTLRMIATYSHETGLPVHIHLHETSDEIDESIARHGKRPFARLDALGLVGPELIAVHAVHMEEAELRQIAECGASIAHCPHSNLKLASGFAPTARMRELGIRVGIGTDGAASNNRLDLIQEAHTAALLAKCVAGRADAWPAADMLRAMTLDPATALGLDSLIGSIEVGKRADLVAIDLGVPELQPVFDPIAQLIHAAGREHVQHVWVDGESVVWKRQLARDQAKLGLSEVVGRTSVWQNRLGEIMSG